MYKIRIDDDEHTIIDNVHYISEFDLENTILSREIIVDEEIKIMEKELKEDYPEFDKVFSYPQRKYMSKKDNEYKNALYNLEDMGNGHKALKVTTRAVLYK